MRRTIAVGVVIVLLVVAAIGWQRCRGGGSGSSTTKPTAGSTSTTGDAKQRTRTRGPMIPASMSGRVTREKDGGGIEGAVVAISPASLMSFVVKADAQTVTVTTDANGNWEAKTVIPGVYIVAAAASGFLPAHQRKIVVAAGEKRTGIDLALVAGGTIVRGTVTDVGGGPVADARITAMVSDRMPELSGVPDYTAISKPDGKYEITLPDDTFTLRASHDDYVAVGKEIDVEGKPLTVDFELIPGAIIRGQVVSRDDGKPVSNALIRAEGGRGGRNGGGDRLVRAEPDGTFVLRGLGSGEIQLHAIASGYATTNPTEVSLAIGEQVDGVRVYVDRAFSISGRVVKKGTKDGIAGVMLGAFSIATQQFGLAPEPSDKDGAFEIVGVKPASYMLFAVGEGAVPDIGKNVDVVDKDVDDVTIELAIGATIAGRVEPPLVNAAISMELDGDIGIGNMFDAAKTFLVHGNTNEQGAFTLTNVPAGKFKINATAPEGQTGELPVVIADADQSGLVVMLQTRATVSGRVIDTNGKAVGGARVSARAIDPDPKKQRRFSFRGGAEATTAPDGTFKIVGIEAGKVRVRAGGDREEEFEVMMDEDKAKAPKSVVELDLVAGKEKANVTLTVEARDGVIRGLVLGPDGKPTPDAWVTAARTIDESKDPKMAKMSRRWRPNSPPVLTGQDGKFTITKLRTGTYDLTVEGPRGATRAEKDTIKTGETVTITLASLGSIEGKVTLGAEPVTEFDIACDGPTDKSRHVSSKDGSYSLVNLAPGSYDCEVDTAAGSAKEKLDVAAAPLAHDFKLARWAVVTGVVVNVLTKQPIAGVFAFANPAGGDQNGKSFGAMISGRAPTSDPQGRFTIEKVATGKGELQLFGKDGFAPAAKRDYEVTEGQRLDLGTIPIVPPRVGDAGTFGFATDVKDGKLVVTSVQPGGPAATAGVQENDVITAISGRSVADMTPELSKTLLSSGVVGVGMPVKLTIDRNGTPVEAAVQSIKW